MEKVHAGRVADAVGPDAMRFDAVDAAASSRLGHAADGSAPPQPEGRQGFAGTAPSGASRTARLRKTLLSPCPQPQSIKSLTEEVQIGCLDGRASLAFRPRLRGEASESGAKPRGGTKARAVVLVPYVEEADERQRRLRTAIRRRSRRRTEKCWLRCWPGYDDR